MLKKKGSLYYPNKEIRKKAWVNTKSIYKEGNKDPLKFWRKLSKEILWEKDPKKIFVHTPPTFKWFEGGKLNITKNALDRHLKKKKEQGSFNLGT